MGEGMSVEEIEGIMMPLSLLDWVHGLGKAPMLKAQHPDYEVFL